MELFALFDMLSFRPRRDFGSCVVITWATEIQQHPLVIDEVPQFLSISPINTRLDIRS